LTSSRDVGSFPTKIFKVMEESYAMVHSTGFRVGDGEAIARLWNRSVPADPITVRRLRRLILLDVNFDPQGLRLAWNGDRLIGACYAVRRTVAMVGDDLEPRRGWIPFFFVDPDHRRQGVAAQLLREAMDWLRGHDRHEVDFSSYTPNYILPGLDRHRYPAASALLDSFGFTTLYQAVAMDLPLSDYRLPDEVAERIESLNGQGYRFAEPSPDELVPLIDLAHHHFNPDWGRAIREAALSGMPLDRIVAARDPEGQLIGWGMCGAYEAVIDRFGPFGVVTNRRGLGLGETLLHLSLQRMRALGAHSAWFLWAGENSPAGRLYRKTGFSTTRTFDVLRAPLAGEKETP
jgi:GNAT superfamily N-acetyltransferase